VGNIRIQAVRFSGPAQWIEVAEGSSLQAFLMNMGWRLKVNEAVLVNGLAPDPERILEGGDFVVLACGIRGELTVKRDGVWRLHQNDADPWPSYCHAHNEQNRREVLDLRTGCIFDKITRQYVRSLSKRDLKYVREGCDLKEDGSAER
jgi:hypothetical protein